MRAYNRGATVVVREVWKGKIWSGRPLILVLDQPDLLVMFMPAGTHWVKPTTLAGGTLRIPKEEWALADSRHPHNMLIIAEPGSDHSVRLIWSETDHEFLRWYINFEDPFVRTSIGFDYMDHVLDIVVLPDLSDWRWKDEDELEEALELGILSSKRARELRYEGVRVIKMIEQRESPFDGGWLLWRPDPSWAIPKLPEGWDILVP